MESIPRQTEVLVAISQFLESQVRPTIADPAIAFRLLIAANLLLSIALEAEQGATKQLLRRSRLLAALRRATGNADAATSEGEFLQLTPSAQRSELSTLSEKLTHALLIPAASEKSQDSDAAAMLADIQALLQHNLEEELAITNPRFFIG
jgi:hypothetical protein